MGVAGHSSEKVQWGRRMLTIVVVAPVVIWCIVGSFGATLLLVSVLNIASLLEYRRNIGEGLLARLSGGAMARGVHASGLAAWHPACVASNEALLPVLGALSLLGTARGGAAFAASMCGCLLLLLQAHILRAGSGKGFGTQGAQARTASGVTPLAMVSLLLDALGLVYVGGGYGFLLLQRGKPSTRAMAQTLSFCLCVWNTDNGALFAGRTLGRRPLIPAVSSGKTVEGALGGVALSVATAAACPHLFPATWLAPPNRSCVGPLTLGLLVGLAAVCGDLVLSFMKRAAGIKDSGRFFPGHGGCLDRMDSFLLAGPVVYFLTHD